MAAPRKCEWVPQSNGQIPRFAMMAGLDNNASLYVARARHENGLVPGKLHEGHSSVYIPYNGEEIAKSQYEVLICPPQALSWVDASGSNIHPHALSAGQDPKTRETYYIGRALHRGTVTIGKIHPSHGCVYVAHGGKEHRYTTYEVLVKNALGRALNV